MPPKNTLKEDENPQEVKPGKTILATKNQKKIRMIGPGGQEVEYVIKESDSESRNDGVYVESETVPVHFDLGGNPMNLESGFMRLSFTGLPITSPEQWALCTSRFHRHTNRNIFVGVDGSSLGNGEGICGECQKTLTTIHIVLTILGIGVAYGLFQALRAFY